MTIVRPCRLDSTYSIITGCPLFFRTAIAAFFMPVGRLIVVGIGVILSFVGKEVAPREIALSLLFCKS